MKQLCGDQWGSWFCTRPHGHDGHHIATIGPYKVGVRVFADWSQPEPQSIVEPLNDPDGSAITESEPDR